jgi:hypothetical protein
MNDLPQSVIVFSGSTKTIGSILPEPDHVVVVSGVK